MDRSVFKNVIYNLLDNAIKYDPDNEPIIIDIQRNAGTVQIKIRDQGPGIPKDHHKNVFDKFYRLPSDNIHNVKGNGLGLYYVKKHIEEAGGTVKIMPVDKGSEFIIHLPSSHGD